MATLRSNLSPIDINNRLFDHFYGAIFEIVYILRVICNFIRRDEQHKNLNILRV